jgi:hypothetical protein
MSTLLTPTPAAVRAALKNGVGPLSVDESREYRADPRPPDYLLRDHIRAVAADLRSQASICEEQDGSYLSPLMLRTFADRLEGKA